MRELALHVLDLLQNAREAGATRVRLTVDEDTGTRDRLTIRVEDNGRGMGETDMKKAQDPFFTTRTTRHVGLGLPLLAAAAQRCNGSLQLQSAPGAGTRVTAVFQHSHVDRAPLGDLPSTLLAFVLGGPFCDLGITHRRDGREWSLDTGHVREVLAPVHLCDPAVRDWLKHTLTRAEARLRAPAGPGAHHGHRRIREEEPCHD